MKIIVLQGMPDTGKTSTIWLVRDELLKQAGVSDPSAFQVFPNPPKPDDFKDVITYKGQNIALYSMGDYSTYLANAVNDFHQKKCNIFICALSTNTTKVKANNALNQFNAIRIQKTIANPLLNNLQANVADANSLFNLI